MRLCVHGWAYLVSDVVSSRERQRRVYYRGRDLTTHLSMWAYSSLSTTETKGNRALRYRTASASVGRRKSRVVDLATLSMQGSPFHTHRGKEMGRDGEGDGESGERRSDRTHTPLYVGVQLRIHDRHQGEQGVEIPHRIRQCGPQKVPNR